MIGPGLDLDHVMDARLDVLDRQPEHLEPAADHGGVIVEGQEQVPEVIGPTIAIVEHDQITDHRIVDRERSKRTSNTVDDCRGLEPGPHSAGPQIGLAAEGAAHPVEPAGTAQDLLR